MAEDIPRPIKRTVSVIYAEPWLLGWCRWEINTDLYVGESPNDGTMRSVLARGRWKWRGRCAQYREMIVDAEPYWRGETVRLERTQ